MLLQKALGETRSWLLPVSGGSCGSWLMALSFQSLFLFAHSLLPFCVFSFVSCKTLVIGWSTWIIQDDVILKSLITSAKILLANKVTFTGYGIECGRILWGPPFCLLQWERKVPDTKDSGCYSVGFLVLPFHRPLTVPPSPIVSFFLFVYQLTCLI